ncbi:hypothetical protein N9T73_00520, partial [bacterium]|nr:hypothetical protein [bacterium]
NSDNENEYGIILIDNFFSFFENIDEFGFNSNNSTNHIIVPYNELTNYAFINISNIINDFENYPIIHENDTNFNWLCSTCGLLVNVLSDCCNNIYTWECNECNIENSCNNIKCCLCEKEREWLCDVCDHTNTYHTIICEYCLTHNENILKQTCNICNETKLITNRYICNHCNHFRKCNCENCISHIIHIPFVVRQLLLNLDSDNDLDDLDDLDELNDWEYQDIDNGLNEDEIKKITKIEFTSIKKEICTICFDKFENKDMLYSLNCCHNYHINCLNVWISTKNTCPNCRNVINKK